MTLRSRILLGSVLWTAGLLAVTHVASVTFMIRFPGTRGIAHSATLLTVAVVCMAAGLSQARIGLSSVKPLRARLSAVRDGRDRRVEGTYPSEVQPLVNDLNALLEHRERIVSRALAKAGDLAHGLKTPLAVLSQEATRAEAAGHHDLAATMSQQVERMRRQVDYHLAHARAAASGATPGARCSVRESAEGLARTLLRLHAGRELSLAVDVPPEHAVRGQREDLDEMLGTSSTTPASGPRLASRSLRPRTMPTSSSSLTTMDRGSHRRCGMWSCSEGCAPTKRRRVPGSASRSFAISPRCTGDRLV